jgi:phosphoglycerate dehydrogenase-like enzyme
MYKILTTYDNIEGLDALFSNKEFKIEIRNKPSQQELKELIKEYDGLLIRSEVKATKDIIEAAQKLKFIGRAGAGIATVKIIKGVKGGFLCRQTN